MHHEITMVAMLTIAVKLPYSKQLTAFIHCYTTFLFLLCLAKFVTELQSKLWYHTLLQLRIYTFLYTVHIDTVCVHARARVCVCVHFRNNTIPLFISYEKQYRHMVKNRSISAVWTIS